MQHYIAPDNSWHFIDPAFAHWLPEGSIAIPTESANIIQSAASFISAKSKILAEIFLLESAITPRMIRESALGAASEKLLEIDANIKALRVQLQTASTEMPNLSYLQIQESPTIYGAGPETPTVPAVMRQETFEEYVARLSRWLQDHG
jgi:hypothetical protein